MYTVSGAAPVEMEYLCLLQT